MIVVSVIPEAEKTDTRLNELVEWVTNLKGEAAEISPASSDASFRRYFRFNYPDSSYIAMDAPPPQEDCRPFVQIASMLQDAGLHVPAIIAQDLERGYLLLSDLGHQTFLEVINEGNADEFFTAVIPALVQMQQIKVAPEFPRYDRALLERELNLFPDWYLDKELKFTRYEFFDKAWEILSGKLIDHALGQPQVFVHRDFMPRNLMLSTPNPGVLDFQDAVLGPVSYDPICLFKDAFLSWPEDDVSKWLKVYWEQAIEAGLPVPASFEQFYRDCDLMGAHRHLKVIGIFARICHRDGKPKYLGDVPRFFAYLKTVAARQPELSSLKIILGLLEAARVEGLS